MNIKKFSAVHFCRFQVIRFGRVRAGLRQRPEFVRRKRNRARLETVKGWPRATAFELLFLFIFFQFFSKTS